MSLVVSDTGPLHYLILCGEQDLLRQLFGEHLIPLTEFRELQQPNTPESVRRWSESLPAWVQVRAPTTLNLSLDVDQGELEAICLAEGDSGDATADG